MAESLPITRVTFRPLAPLEDHMQKLRNLKLAVRLGIAFGALGLGLLVVSVVAFKSTGNLDTKVHALAVDVPQYTAVVDGIAARMPEEGHLLAQHLYVYDGDIKAQDKVAKRFETLAAQDEKALRGDARGARQTRPTRRRGPRPTASRSCGPVTSRCSTSRARPSRRRARRPSTTSRSASARARSTRRRS